MTVLAAADNAHAQDKQTAPEKSLYERLGGVFAIAAVVDHFRTPSWKDSIRVQLPPAAALRRSHTRGPRPPPFPRDSCVSWHTVNLRSAHLAPIIRTSEHFHVFSPPPRLSVRMFGSGGKKRAIASSNCAAL